MLRFIGFTEIDAIVIEPTLQGGPVVAEHKLAEALHAAREKAKTFRCPTGRASRVFPTRCWQKRRD